MTFCITTPFEAFKRVEKTLKEMINLKVVGIAGPGEPLFNDETFETLKLVQGRFPDLVRCIASNGLLLSEKVGELIDLGVKTATVSINSLDPKIGAKIYPWVKLKKSQGRLLKMGLYL